jgi:hypothetical protein
MLRIAQARSPKRRALALALSGLILTGLSGCGSDSGDRTIVQDTIVTIKNGINAGKKYTPELAGGLGIDQCIQQNICVKKQQ